MPDMNSKVYVITKGSYSDYHICAVTMDKARAENLKKLFSDRYDEATVEEYILNECKENGSMYYVDFPDDEPQRIGLDEFAGAYVAPNMDRCVLDWYDPIRVYVRAKDEQHAIKIAQDEYAKWKAEKEGVV